ncbi:MAG: hypothetical protein IKY88_04135 [Phascolarctobacterium sp.]|nr:hypothetical protein [Phascolarctobacterium sp.]
MLIRELFPKQFTILRNSHNLGVRDVAAILNIKSPSNISSWEQHRLIPSLDVFCDILTLFSVSSDWLLGYSDNPYNVKVISSIESSLFAETIENNGVNIPLLRKVSWMTEEYWNAELRSKTYSLAVRANIVFLLHIYIANQRALLARQFERENNVLLSWLHDKQRYFKILFDQDGYKKKEKQLDLYYKQLQELLAAKESAKPIFDIQAQKTTEE